MSYLFSCFMGNLLMKISSFLARGLEVAIIIVLAERGCGGGAATANDSKKALFSLLTPLPWRMDGFEDFPFGMTYFLRLGFSRAAHARLFRFIYTQNGGLHPFPCSSQLRCSTFMIYRETREKSQFGGNNSRKIPVWEKNSLSVSAF